MTRHVGHRIHGHIEVYGYAQSIPEALALEFALKNVPRASAFQPEPPPACMGDSGDFNGWANVAEPTTTVAELPTLPDGHPASADESDNTGDLKAGEAP